MTVIIDTRGDDEKLDTKLSRLYRIIDDKAFGFRIKEVILLHKWYEQIAGTLNALDRIKAELPENAQAILVACRKRLDVLEQSSGLPVNRHASHDNDVRRNDDASPR